MKLLFIDGTKDHNPRLLYDKPTGGTLTSLTKVPEYLASLGHEVWVQSTYPVRETHNGVTYIQSGDVIPKWDVTIFNRNVIPMQFAHYCKDNGIKMIWWLHDIVDTRYLPDGAFKLTDHVVALSNYCKDTFTDFYNLIPEKVSVISNGIDPEVYYAGKWENRNPHLYITASALIKGYMPLDVTFANLKMHDPDVDFRIYSSQKLHGFDNSPNQAKFLDNMMNNGAHIYAPTNQKVMSHLMRKAWALLMPNSYPEICSNLLLQARACGLPVISSNIGANPEFLQHKINGLVTTKWHPHDIHSWIVEFATHACQLQQDKDLHKQLSLAAPIGVPTWREIGEKWNELLKSL